MKKCVTDITEIKVRDGKLYVYAISDCYDLLPNGLAMADNMRAEQLFIQTEGVNTQAPYTEMN